MATIFVQSARRNLATPILLALAVLGIAVALVLGFTPHTTASVIAAQSAVYATHTVFKKESILVADDRFQDDLYVLVTLHIDNHLRLPIFLSDFTATLTPSTGEPLTTSAVQKLDLPILYASFPALKTIADAQPVPLLLRETQIDPGKSATGFIVLHFPVTQPTWDHRQSSTITLALYHQQPITIPLPPHHERQSAKAEH